MADIPESKLSGREYLGDVVLSTGDKIKVYMPCIGDIFSLDFKDPSAIYYVAASACNMHIDKFKKLTIQDGVAIVEKVGDGITAIARLQGTRIPKSGGK